MNARYWQMLTMRGPELPTRPTFDSRGRKYEECVLTPQRISGYDGIGQRFEYGVEAGKPANPLPAIFDEDERERIDLDRIAGTEIWLTIDLERIGVVDGKYRLTWSSGAGVRHINGIIGNARVLGDEGPNTVYEFIVHPSFWLATLQENSRFFKGSIADILHEVIRPYGQIEWRINPDYYPQRDYIRQAWESDWNFFMRLCEEWGYVVWIEHREQSHVLVIADNPHAYRKHERAYETLRYHAGGGHINEEPITAMTYASAVTPGRVTVQDHSHSAPRLVPYATPFRETYDKPRKTANADHEIYTHADFAQPATRRDAPYDETNWREEARHFARVKLESRTSVGSRASAKGALRGVEVGKTLSVTHYLYHAANCEYLVLSCDMDIRATGTLSSTERVYDISASFVMQPLRERYRMPQVTPRPVIGGQEYAVIIGPDHAEMCVDKYNRALVQFIWDRDGKYDGKSAIWVRLATAWHGMAMAWERSTMRDAGNRCWSTT
ncbi:type VI secretion system VgrG family protein [Paraburkholderia bannensis]|uniref:Type VI secretion system VgrG family protein n=1 Tax=Paraburkholderia bannensis TaxID=765414 RepID=A0A7W9U1L5_9BURK|nr:MULTISPECIES: type VI secretion system Vgr family protein [Paraburkholderia]MBB3259110.1 type VI secretion system VgrG family protein [Paraburkholderia sp. WP4_3_2]MBB6104125.1 type VI secretion system VgrG family protein [Paraburkholderia bannensis]